MSADISELQVVLGEIKDLRKDLNLAMQRHEEANERCFEKMDTRVRNLEDARNKVIGALGVATMISSVCGYVLSKVF